MSAPSGKQDAFKELAHTMDDLESFSKALKDALASARENRVKTPVKTKQSREKRQVTTPVDHSKYKQVIDALRREAAELRARLEMAGERRDAEDMHLTVDEQESKSVNSLLKQLSSVAHVQNHEEAKHIWEALEVRLRHKLIFSMREAAALRDELASTSGQLNQSQHHIDIMHEEKNLLQNTLQTMHAQKTIDAAQSPPQNKHKVQLEQLRAEHEQVQSQLTRLESAAQGSHDEVRAFKAFVESEFSEWSAEARANGIKGHSSSSSSSSSSVPSSSSSSSPTLTQLLRAIKEDLRMSKQYMQDKLDEAEHATAVGDDALVEMDVMIQAMQTELEQSKSCREASIDLETANRGLTCELHETRTALQEAQTALKEVSSVKSERIEQLQQTHLTTLQERDGLIEQLRAQYAQASTSNQESGSKREQLLRSEVDRLQLEVDSKFTSAVNDAISFGKELAKKESAQLQEEVARLSAALESSKQLNSELEVHVGDLMQVVSENGDEEKSAQQKQGVVAIHDGTQAPDEKLRPTEVQGPWAMYVCSRGFYWFNAEDKKTKYQPPLEWLNTQNWPSVEKKKGQKDGVDIALLKDKLEETQLALESTVMELVTTSDQQGALAKEKALLQKHVQHLEQESKLREKEFEERVAIITDQRFEAHQREVVALKAEVTAAQQSEGLDESMKILLQEMNGLGYLFHEGGRLSQIDKNKWQLLEYKLRNRLIHSGRQITSLQQQLAHEGHD